MLTKYTCFGKQTTTLTIFFVNNLMFYYFFKRMFWPIKPLVIDSCSLAPYGGRAGHFDNDRRLLCWLIISISHLSFSFGFSTLLNPLKSSIVQKSLFANSAIFHLGMCSLFLFCYIIEQLNCHVHLFLYCIYKIYQICSLSGCQCICQQLLPSDRL